MIGLADTPRATARVTVQILKDLGISTVILTGDCSGAAAAVMKATGAENYIASMKPEHKLEWIRNCQVWFYLWFYIKEASKGYKTVLIHWWLV